MMRISQMKLCIHTYEYYLKKIFKIEQNRCLYVHTHTHAHTQHRILLGSLP